MGGVVKIVKHLFLFAIFTMPWLPSSKGPQGTSPAAAVWYDVETVANTDTTAASSASGYEWAVVTVTVGGSATKARIWLQDSLGSGNIKMAVYAAAGGAPLASGTTTMTAADDMVYKEITFSVPITVTATTYIISWAFDNADAFMAYKASSGNWKAKLTDAYSGFPYNPLGTPDFTLSRGYAVSLYVQ